MCRSASVSSDSSDSSDSSISSASSGQDGHHKPCGCPDETITPAEIAAIVKKPYFGDKCKLTRHYDYIFTPKPVNKKMDTSKKN